MIKPKHISSLHRMVQGTGDMLKDCFVHQEPSAFSSGGQESLLKRIKLLFVCLFSFYNPAYFLLHAPFKMQNVKWEVPADFLVLKKQDCAGSCLTEVLMCDCVGGVGTYWEPRVGKAPRDLLSHRDHPCYLTGHRIRCLTCNVFVQKGELEIQSSHGNNMQNMGNKH